MNKPLLQRSFVFIGIAGWIILIIPELHFLYKDYLMVLGQWKFAALILAGLGMFIALPIWLTESVYRYFSLQFARYVVMGAACLVSIWIARFFM